MKTIILGGFGFWGWSTALRLSHKGHRVATVDNLSHRRIEDALINRFDCDGDYGTVLKDALLAETAEIAGRFKKRFDPAGAPARSLWTRDNRPGVAPPGLLQENAR